jgi:hypothetical protein
MSHTGSSGCTRSSNRCIGNRLIRCSTRPCIGKSRLLVAKPPGAQLASRLPGGPANSSVGWFASVLKAIQQIDMWKWPTR